MNKDLKIGEGRRQRSRSTRTIMGMKGGEGINVGWWWGDQAREENAKNEERNQRRNINTELV